MKLVKRDILISLSEGVLYSEYTPQIFEGLNIKGKTWIPTEEYSGDWLYQPIIDSLEWGTTCTDAFDKLDEGKSVQMDFNCQSRDGMFDDNQLYAVWEKEDVIALIARLQEALKIGYP